MSYICNMLVSYFSPSGASSLKAVVLPTKPLGTTSALVGKAYTAAGQAAGCSHTMAVLQAYQAELLELDEEDTIKSDDFDEIRRATDLSLRATKETAKAIGRSMAVLVVTERRLWLTLSRINNRDKAFLLNAPVSPSDLFGSAVNSVVHRFQEAKKQATDSPVPSPRGWTIGFSERGVAHNRALPRCLSSRRCMRS